ncbi:rhomboid family intramembrane serine protease [Thalassococcus sp. S3]|uniref:rhomboid family intramembrane serine protease n=1 Tax=Thalassococcus sp. S3 TaxID=2017482 RepID=UPI00102491BE|nr:rhomboid family intramembrane serine protease [Thalassococcus sp. S3]QBF33601.1 rhomboid family intramembrane serine protease [Thalassococcus sp. S3]
MSSSPQIPAVNPLPPVVVALFLVILCIEIAFSLGARGLVGGPAAVGWRLAALQSYAFSGDIFDWMWQSGRWPIEHVIRFLSFPFVHGSFTHTIFAGVILLAMGKMVGEVFGSVATVIIFFGSGALGVLAYAILLNDPAPIVGAFPNVYGLIGAFTFMLWRSLSSIGANQARAFTLIGILMGIQLVFGLLFGLHNDWVADLAGFAAGFGMSFFIAPGGWSAIIDRVRRD